jgi:hypothetical protein
MWLTIIREFFIDLKKQKLRSSLTLVAIAWGTLSVVLLLAFGRGLGTSLMEGMLGAGNQVIMVYGGQTSQAYEGHPEGRTIRFTEEDVRLIERAVPGISPIPALSMDGAVPGFKPPSPQPQLTWRVSIPILKLCGPCIPRSAAGLSTNGMWMR